MGNDNMWTLWRCPECGHFADWPFDCYGDARTYLHPHKPMQAVKHSVVEGSRLREAEAELADERNRVLGLRQTFNAETELRWKVEAELRELVTASEGVALSASWHEPQSRRLAAALDRARGVLEKNGPAAESNA